MAPSAPEISRSELRWISTLLIGWLAVRVVAAWKVRFTSDESQHLHVVWAWANGLLPYRDVFDNHTPLFHLLCAPVFRLFGETANVMIYMRWAMIPFAVAALWLVSKIGARLFSQRVGWWAAVFGGFFPVCIVKGVEFRTDDLWATAWVASVTIAVGGPLTVRRMFVLGLALGAAFSVSMKTVVLTAGLLLAGLVALAFWWRRGGRWRSRPVWRGLGAGFAGLLIVPGIIVAYFVMKHAAFGDHGEPGTLYYGVIGHNVLPGLARVRTFSRRPFWFPGALPVCIFAAWCIFRWTPDRSLAARRTLVLLSAGFYLALLRSYWPMVTGQDYLPVAPLLLLCATPGVLAISDALHLRWAWLPRFALPLALVVLEAHVSEKIVKLRGNSRADLAGLAEVLRCTDRDDYVMDAKCGAIFRQRPFYYALEDVTEKRIARGLIKDDIVERLIATHTCAARTTRLGDRALHFVKANYLIQGVGYGFAGQFLHPDEQGRSHFEIQIVTTYTILTPQGQATGELDGKAFTGKVLLAAGWHEFVSPQPCGSLAIVWSQAVERGFKPNFLPGLSATETGEE